MTIVEDGTADARDWEGLAITASGIDRSEPTRVPVDRYISPDAVAIPSNPTGKQ